MNKIFKDNYEEKISDFLLDKINNKDFYNYYKKIEGYKSEFYSKNFSYIYIKNKRVCDLACGIGRLIDFHLINKNNHLTLVDIKKKFLLLCEKILKKKILKNIKLLTKI